MNAVPVAAPLRAHDNHTRRVVKLSATPEQTYEVIAHRGKQVIVVARVRAGGRLWIATDDRETPLYSLGFRAKRLWQLTERLIEGFRGR